MPKSNKPILLICGSRSIKSLNLDWYLNADDYSEVISGGATGIDTLAEQWAKRNNLEFCAYLPNYKAFGGKYAPIVRNREMVEFSDECVAFWDGKSKGTLMTIKYALSLDRKVTVHFIEDR